jgi:hypothetical protein
VPRTALNEFAGCGQLDRPPRASCYVRLPESFGRRFMIFCDTEEEFDWGKPHDRNARATTHMKTLPEAQRHMSAFGAKPVYLIDHPIATDPRSVELLRPWQDAGECAVGTQLHPWVNPPFDEEVNRTNSFAGNLPRSLERAKLKCLTETIEENFGRRPVIYRAGRYGVGRNTADLLCELGYRIDVSIRAMFDYSDEKGPNFSRIKPLPYRIGDGHLLEAPLSAAYLGPLRGLGTRVFSASAKAPRVRGALARVGLLNRVPLTPEGTALAEALQAVERLLDDDVQLFSISYHSPSVEPGHTPFVRDQADLDEFYRWWDGVLGLLVRRGVTGASLDDLLEAEAATRPASG